MKKTKSKSTSSIKIFKKRVILGKGRKSNSPKNSSEYLFQNNYEYYPREFSEFESSDSLLSLSEKIGYECFGGSMVEIIDYGPDYFREMEYEDENDLNSVSTAGSFDEEY